MKVTQLPPGFRPRPGLPLFLLALFLLACSKKSEDAPPNPEPSIPPVESLPVPAAEPAEPAVDTATTPGPQAQDPVKPAFRSRPPVKAWPGRPYVYKPALNRRGGFTLRLAQGPDSMRTDGGAITWTPVKPGSFPVVLEASWSTGEDRGSLRQSFNLEVVPVLTLDLKPLPAQADKGDSVLFDLRGSTFPEWAGAGLKVRFDYEGDGTWDTPELPLAENLAHRHAYGKVGRFSPRVEARYLDLETHPARGAIAVISPVDARLILRPDTVEPGGAVSVDASGSKGDGRLTYLLDLDGNGRLDWADSATGKGSLKAPASGRYEARLTVRNSMGLEGSASAPLLVNARLQATLKVKLAKAHMAQSVEAALMARDNDDSLRALRINFTGDKDGWASVSSPDSAKGPGRWRKVFKHVYGKTGKYTVEGCAASADGRVDCRKVQIEIFNAPPVCEPGPDLKATLGVPAEIEGKGKDPDGSIVKWEWDLDGDGKYDVVSDKDGKVKYTFARKGSFALNMRVTTADGMTATGVRKVEVKKAW